MKTNLSRISLPRAIFYFTLLLVSTVSWGQPSGLRLVCNLEANSPAWHEGLRNGDVIYWKDRKVGGGKTIVKLERGTRTLLFITSTSVLMEWASSVDAELCEETLAAAAQEAKEVELNARKNSCTNFGFTPDSDAHAQCVMQLSIAEKAQTASAAEAAAVQAAIKEQQEAQAAANKAAADEAKRRREAAILMGIGGNIASGRAPLDFSTPAPGPGPGMFKTCTYNVMGQRLPKTVGAAEMCPLSADFNGINGFLDQ